MGINRPQSTVSLSLLRGRWGGREKVAGAHIQVNHRNGVGREGFNRDRERRQGRLAEAANTGGGDDVGRGGADRRRLCLGAAARLHLQLRVAVAGARADDRRHGLGLCKGHRGDALVDWHHDRLAGGLVTD